MVEYCTSTEGRGLSSEVGGLWALNTKKGAELAAEQEGRAEPETGTARAGFLAGEIAGASSTGREPAAAADVGAERRERRRRWWETAGAEGAEMKRKTEFALLGMGS